MANLLKEPFSIENVADLGAGIWDIASGVSAVGTTYGRLGGYGAQLQNGGPLRKNIVSTPSTLYVGFAAEFLAGQNFRLQFCDNVNGPMMSLYYDASAALLTVQNYTNATMGTYPLGVDQWNYFEIELVAATSGSGTFLVKMNGSSTIFNLTTQTSGSGTAIYAVQFTSSNTNLADIYINDSTGSTNNGFMGDIKQLVGRPIGAGLDTAWAIGGTSPAATNWQSVADAQPDYDVTYVDDLTPGDIDLYAMSVPSGLDSFESLTVYAMVRKDDAGTRQVAACISDGATVFVGPTYTIGTTYNYIEGTWDTNPFTSAPWAVVDASTLQTGVKVIA